MTTIQPYVPTAMQPYRAPQTYAPVQPQPHVQQPPAPNVQPANYNWSYANPREHIFDHPYDGWALNKWYFKIGGLGFWTRFGPTRALASALSQVPQERLHAYNVREQFMKVPGMRPDWARMYQLAYFNRTGGQMPLQQKMPLQWLAQYGQPGPIGDWTVRAPLMLEMHMLSVQYMTNNYGFHKPEVPGNRETEYIAQQAMLIAPPRPYGGQPGMPGNPGFPQPGYPGMQPGYPGMQPGYPGGYGPYPSYGYGDPITQIGGLIGLIGNLFK